MSYIGRITGRLGRARQGPALIPAGRVASPLANSDQRLHLIGIGPAHGLGGGPGEDDPFAAVAPLARGAGAGAESVSGEGASSDAADRFSGALPVSAREIAPRPAAAHGDAPSSARAFESTSSRSSVEQTSGVRDPVQALVPPPAPRPSHASSAAPAGQDAGKAPAAFRATSAAPADAQRRESGGPQAERAATDAGMAGALGDALNKVTRWMASDPRARPVSPAPRASDAFGPRGEAPPGSARTGVGARRGADGAAWMRAAAGLDSAAARPRLTVGRIDVQVVAPPPPAAPPAAPPARPARGAPPAAPSGPGAAAYLTFGLRQR